jgi:hypothetical protein
MDTSVSNNPDPNHIEIKIDNVYVLTVSREKDGQVKVVFQEHDIKLETAMTLGKPGVEEIDL